MKSFNLKSLLFTAIAIMGITGTANAALSSLTVEATGISVEHAQATAQRLLLIQCNLMFGTLVGEMEVVSEEGYTVVASQKCNH